MREVTIPIEDDAIPSGWELYRIGFPKRGESVICYSADGKPTAITLTVNSRYAAIIIRKKYDPGIALPPDWWVWKDSSVWVASNGLEDYEKSICGLEFLPGFIPPEDGKPRKIT